MFIVWRKQTVKATGGCPFLAEPNMPSGDRTAWKLGLRCGHKGTGRTAWTPLLVIAERVDGKPRQRVAKRFPTIRSCCIASRFHRAAWWYEVDGFFEFIDQNFTEEGTYWPRDRRAILAKLREVVPPPSKRGRDEFTTYRTMAEAEAKRRDDEWWAKARAAGGYRGRVGDGPEQWFSFGDAVGWADQAGGEWAGFNAAFGSAFGPVPPLDCFATLGVAPTATMDQVKARYRDLVKDHHPDRGGDAKAFMRVQEAYETVMRVSFGQ